MSQSERCVLSPGQHDAAFFVRSSMGTKEDWKYKTRLAHHLSPLDTTPFDLGLTNQISKRIKTDVIIRLINFSREEIARFESYPAYVSAIDITWRLGFHCARFLSLIQRNLLNYNKD